MPSEREEKSLCLIRVEANQLSSMLSAMRGRIVIAVYPSQIKARVEIGPLESIDCNAFRVAEENETEPKGEFRLLLSVWGKSIRDIEMKIDKLEQLGWNIQPDTIWKGEEDDPIQEW